MFWVISLVIAPSRLLYFPLWCPGIIVAGKSGSGKSTCIQTVVEAMCLQARGMMSRQSHTSKASATAETMHKLQRIYPMMVDDLSLMFGSLDNNGDWVDGIVTSAIRKSNRVSGVCLPSFCLVEWGIFILISRTIPTPLIPITLWPFQVLHHTDQLSLTSSLTVVNYLP